LVYEVNKINLIFHYYYLDIKVKVETKLKLTSDMKNINKKIIQLLPRNIVYCDVGARGGLGYPWDDYDECIDIIGFEPDKEEFENLSNNKKSNDIFYPYALSNECNNLDLHVTKARGSSSIYKANHQFVKNFSDVERFEIEKIISLEAKTLDWMKQNNDIYNIDFIKLDIQGSELDVLKGGQNILSDNVLGIEVEVEFSPVYSNQPLFSDVDLFVRKHLGLELYDIKKTFWKHPVGIDVGSEKGQLIWGDALYFRSPHEIIPWCNQFEKKEAISKLNIALSMGVVYGYLDYSLSLLNQSEIGDYLDLHTIKIWKELIYIRGKSLHYRGIGADRLSSLFNLLSHMFKRAHKGWCTIDQPLGAEKKYGIYR
jgi:FkbM family methyltransferase